jgi:hypothetical protein
MDTGSKWVEIGEALKMAASRLLVPLTTTREVDEDAFRDLHEAALELVRCLKGRAEVPKGTRSKPALA